jgi:F420-non-reducing hydrogenase iron-sulfur subunit
MQDRKDWQPKIIAFLCNWCSYAGADLAGTSRIQYDTAIRQIRVMCSGRVEPSFVLKAFSEGADGVLIAGCHIPSDCHYISGNFKALKRYETFLPLLEELGIERERIRLEWISASEGEKFANVVNEFTQTIRKLGPLNLSKKKRYQAELV